MGLRERLRAALTRGKVECSLRIELTNNESNELALNHAYAEKVVSALKSLQTIAGAGEINLVDVLRYPGVVDSQNQDLDQIAEDLLASFEQILADFIAMRGREGEKLQAIIQQRLDGITLEAEKVRSQLEANIALFCQIYQFKPELIAIDSHVGYFTHEVGKRLAAQHQIPYVEVLHHHAHIVSVMAEHHCHEQVIGLALDGIGMGENGQLWGGECLLVDEKHCHYLGGLPAVALLGGDLAAKQPWRNWLAHLHQFVPNWQEIAAQTCADYDWQLLSKAIERNLNSPRISSAGRLFDAVAFGLGITPPQLSWEGEAACQLEVLASQSALASLPFDKIEFPTLMPLNAENKLDLAHFWQAWIALDSSNADKAFIFHYS